MPPRPIRGTRPRLHPSGGGALILGCVLAGGQSTRFGRDKALAQLGNTTLLAQAVAQLAQWCDAVVVVGRREAPALTLPDWPGSGLGPLGGIAAALRHAEKEGFGAVLTVGVDSLGLPPNLPELLSPAPAFLAGQPVIGLWSDRDGGVAGAARAVEAILAGTGRHSMRAFAEALGARAVPLDVAPANINTPADLALWRQQHRD